MQGSKQQERPYWRVKLVWKIEIIKVYGAVRIVESMLQYLNAHIFQLSHSSLTLKAPGNAGCQMLHQVS